VGVVVTACLAPLRNDQVNSRVHGLLRRDNRAHLLPDLDAYLVQRNNELRRWMTPMEGHNGYTLIDANLDLSIISKKGNEVDVQWTVGRGLNGFNEVTHGLSRQWTNGE